MKIRELADRLILYLGATCHRRPERSFECGEHQSIMCVRCSSVYVGFLVTMIFMLAYGFYFAEINTLFSLALALPLAVDVFTQNTGKRESNNYLRIVTGVLLGSSPALLFGKSIQSNFGLMVSGLVKLPSLVFLLFLLSFALILFVFLRNPSPKNIYLVDGLVVSGFTAACVSLAAALAGLVSKYLVYA